MLTIVGAGAAGLSLALLSEGPVVVLEQAREPGGLCRSRTLGGFTFDQGPHILGGIPDAVAWIVKSSGLEFVEGRTRNRGWVRGEWVQHPFEREADGQAYMAKMWKHPPSDLSTAGLGAQAGRKPGGVHFWRYPARGGYQAITDSWADRLDGRLVCGQKVTEVDGPTVWTAPVGGVEYNALTVTTIGILGPAPDLTAVYLPEPWTPFHRLSFPSAFSPHNAPKGCYSIQGEVSGRRPPTGLVECLEDTARHLGLVTGSVVMWHEEVVQNAYPVPLGHAPEPPGQAVPHGRTGAGRYMNLDGVVAASMALVG